VVEDLFTVEEVAAMLKVESTTVRRWLREEKIKGKKIGKSWRISEENLREAFPPGAFEFPSENSEVDVFHNDELYKKLHPKRYEQSIQEQSWSNEHDPWDNLPPWMDTVRMRFPALYNNDDIIDYYDDGQPIRGNDQPEADYAYYSKILNNEHKRLDKILKLLQEKYCIKETDISEIKRAIDNVVLLSLYQEYLRVKTFVNIDE
jgi:excisionase family DNA binding protein